MADRFSPAPIVLFLAVIATMALAWIYFRRFAIARPPIGVMNRADVVIILALTTVFTLADAVLPAWMSSLLVGAGALSALYVLLEPVIRSFQARWLIVLGAIVLEVAGRAWLGPNLAARYALNDVLVILTAAGVANLWAQSGLKAGDAAILGIGLAIYDEITTVRIPFTREQFTRVINEPFAPILAWATDASGAWLGIGLGDVLVASLFVLVMRKGYGRAAAIVAFSVNLVALGALLAPAGIIDPNHPFPVMDVLGPLMLLQYAAWRWRRGKERTTREYLRGKPLGFLPVRPERPRLTQEKSG